MSLGLIPKNYVDLLKDEVRTFAYLATIMADGSPQATPVWFNTDGEYILINSAQGRVKDRNMRSRPHVSLVLQDPSNPYRYLQVKGRVVEITTIGAREHIDTLSGKYTGKNRYEATRPGDVRVTYKIQPEKVSGMG
jgi:PPOX class probable F420-dependent enzyme